MVGDDLFSLAESDKFLSGWHGSPSKLARMKLMRTPSSHHPSGETVLKKAAIIVAGSAAIIVAASPLALADTFNHSPQCNAAKQTVGNYIPQSATGVTAPLLGALGLAVNAAAPVTAQAQAPIASCNNVENVLNTHIHDNLQDNSKNIDKSVTRN